MTLTLDTLLKSKDQTAKFLFRLYDSQTIESVLVPFQSRDAVCLSTQVGCAMGCEFCYTSQMGLKRNLSSHEIIDQYLAVKKWVSEQDQLRLPPNIVFMGQGEPLHNFEELKLAIQWLTEKTGLGPRNITVSTVGFIPGLQRFNELGGVNLALSLHTPFEDERSQIIPLNRRWPLKDIFSALDQVQLRNKQFINCEYLMMKDFNMTALHADELAKWLKGRPALVNLIPFNPYPEAPWKRPSGEEIEEFKQLLVAHGLRVFLRTTKGDDIMAACGQLHTKGLQ
jgi:23S rRNA (adenine2503-C2)-methyltransferase